MSMEDESIFGPGTDLVISLFSISLILIGIVAGLYLEAINSYSVTLDDKSKLETRLGEQDVLLEKNGSDIDILNAALKKWNERYEKMIGSKSELDVALKISYPFE